MSEILRKVLQQNWPYYTHQQLYDMVRTEAAGALVLFEADQAWTEFTKLMADSRREIDRLLREAGASWEGVAADSMQEGVTPLAQWVDDAGAAGQASAKGLQQVGESFTYTAHSMPEPVRPAVNSTYPTIFGGLIDQERQERQAQEAKQRAVELMQRYSTNAHSAVSSLGVFVAPQEVTVRPGPVDLPGGGTVQRGGNVIVTAPPPETVQAPAETGGTARDEVKGSAGKPATEVAGRSLQTSQTQATPGLTTPSQTVPATEALSRQATGGFAAGTGVPGTARPPGRAGELSGLGERPAPGPGAGSGGGGRFDGGAARGQGATIAARAGAIGAGPAMAPAAAARREEDKDHVSPEYLQAYHDAFWDTAPAASPAVIGDDAPEH